MLCRASFGLCGVVSILLDIPGLAPAELSFHYCRSGCMAVSYTHLTLPTNREV